MPRPFRRAAALLRWSKRQSPTRRLIVDCVVIFGIAVLLRVVTLPLDLFEQAHHFSRAHEEWELDEILVTVMILSIAFLVFGVRRIADQRRELSLRRAAEHHATMLALQDPLTGLPNRRRLQEALSTAPASDGKHAVMIMDLDGFKPVNDTFGHGTGDEALRTVAQRLKATGDSRILAARLGGDEFALFVRGIVSDEEACQIAENIVATIEVPIVAGGAQHRLEASIGIAVSEPGANTPEELLRRADVALYRAKNEPGSRHCFYSAAMDQVLQERLKLERELHAALDANQIVPHYQPIVDLKTGAIVKFEALARWRHETMGDIPPMRFIELAEQRGMIGEVTEKIVRRACTDALSWPSSVMLAVNLSPALLHYPGFPLRLAKILADTGLPPSRLEVEITEQALDLDPQRARTFLDNLRSAGVRIALDDFGTGYSSLSRLKELPFDEIKIDRSFVQNLTSSEDSAVIVRAIIELGRGLGMTLTAEGIEEQAQRDSLIAQGCQQGQGYLFSRAVPAAEAAALFAGPERLVAAE